ncbi:hypothetical protein CASFOL_034045 [Castilleja foliolosa]|uniref:S-protein homolog n=1 Tax=Castilleja foliolosa TaxID=1961234 RepID=A0ABD3BZA6_9LAMI
MKLFQVLLLFSIISFQAVDARNCLTPTYKYTIFVANALPQNSPPLYLHCASGDKELGNHTLTAGQNFNFDFCIGFKTLYFCHLWWNGKNIAFDVFNNKVDEKCVPTLSDGNKCYFEGRSDGIYFANDYPPKDFTKQYSW